MMRWFKIILLLLLFADASGQVGGGSAYAFLNLPNSARTASLGGKTIAISDDDLNMSFQNPSLLNSSMADHIALNFVNYFAGVKYGYASYARDYRDKGTFAAGIQYLNYGEFTAANDLGYQTGTFRASDYALQLSWSKNLDSLFRIGVTLKPVLSHLERYSSFGILFDAGITWQNPAQLFTAAVVVKNTGTQLKTYYGEHEKMPFEIMAGVSQKLKHAPFRFSMVLQHLEKPDMTYTSEIGTDPDYLTVDNRKESNFGDKLMRHLILGIEFIPGKNFYLNAGYNYQRRKELQVPARTGMTGFSWGAGITIKKVRISYGNSRYHLAGASDHFSISFDLGELYSGNKN